MDENGVDAPTPPAHRPVGIAIRQRQRAHAVSAARDGAAPATSHRRNITAARHLDQNRCAPFQCGAGGAQGHRRKSCGPRRGVAFLGVPSVVERDDAWRLGAKAISIYRDGSKENQVLSFGQRKEEAERLMGAVLDRPETLFGFTTKTKTGLKVQAQLVERQYDTGTKVTDAEMRGLPIKWHARFPKWNYAISPGPPDPN